MTLRRLRQWLEMPAMMEANRLAAIAMGLRPEHGIGDHELPRSTGRLQAARQPYERRL